MTRKLPGMTLLETLVVIMITAILLGLGLAALIGLRNRLMLKNSASNLVIDLQNVRNDARNSVLIGKLSGQQGDVANIDAVNKLDYYVVKFADETYYRGTCDDNTTGLVCTFQGGKLQSSIYDVVGVQADNDKCQAILFYLSTGKYTFGQIEGNSVRIYDNIDECTYTLTHKQMGLITTHVKLTKSSGKIEIL